MSLNLRMRFDSYLRATVVLAIDIAVSVGASAALLLGLYFLEANSMFSDTDFAAVWLLAAFVGSSLSFYITRTYRTIIRHSTLHDFEHLAGAILIKEFVLGSAAMLFEPAMPLAHVGILIVTDFFATLSALMLVRILMLAVYQMILMRINVRKPAEGTRLDVLVYGTGSKSMALATRLSDSSKYNVVGFITPDRHDSGHSLAGLPVHSFATAENVQSIVPKIQGVLFALKEDVRTESERLVDYAQRSGLKMFIAPVLDELYEGKLPSSSIRTININDLLGRPEIKIDMRAINDNFAGKTVLVTGAAGSIGSELCRQLATMDVKHLVMYDNAETPLHNVRLEFEEKFPDLSFTPVIGDVRLLHRLEYVFSHFKPQVVFHAAAYKHVPLMEENPCEAVLVNVAGSRNVANKCVEHGVERMVMVSTDKAVNPTNIMGCTKRLAEIYVQSLGLAIERGLVEGKTTFVTTRFGNVLGSNGSVIPRFAEQIQKGGPVTVTDPEICRFFMTIPEACRLVMQAATMARGTQIFVFDMGSPVRITSLAERMIRLAGFEPYKDIKIEFTGLRPGEKLYEEVLATDENTIPTQHERIFVAKVRQYPYGDAVATVDRLETLSRQVHIPDMVILMKQTVPEFKSKHSRFEQYDHR